MASNLDHTDSTTPSRPRRVGVRRALAVVVGLVATTVTSVIAGPAASAAAAPLPPAFTGVHVLSISGGRAHINDVEIVTDESGDVTFGERAPRTPTPGRPRAYLGELPYEGTCHEYNWLGKVVTCPNPYPAAELWKRLAYSFPGTHSVSGYRESDRGGAFAFSPNIYSIVDHVGAKSPCVGDEAWVEVVARLAPAGRTGVTVIWEARLYEGDFDAVAAKCGDYDDFIFGNVTGSTSVGGRFTVTLGSSMERTVETHIERTLSIPDYASATMSFDINVDFYRDNCDGKIPTIVTTYGEPTTGTPGADVIQGSAGRDRIDGGGGNDVICSLGGDDSVIGGDGDDIIYANDYRTGNVAGTRKQEGADTIDAGAGNDRVFASQYRSRADKVTKVNGGPGNDLLVGNPFKVPAGRAQLNGGPGDDHVIGGVGSQYGDGGPGNDLLESEVGGIPDATGAGDMFSGGEDTDRLVGGGGPDTLFGGWGPDTLEGRGGADSLLGAGDDDLLFDNAGDLQVDGGDGCDRTSAGSECEFSATLVTDDPTAPTERPARQTSNRGGKNTVVRVGAGTYEVHMTNMNPIRGDAEALGTVQVVALGGPINRCTARAPRDEGSSGITFLVECRTAAGVLKDTRFSAWYLEPGIDSGRQIGTVLNDTPNSIRPSGAPGHSVNSKGRPNRITHNAAGRWTVAWGGFNPAPMAVHVTSLIRNTTCRTRQEGTATRVECFDNLGRRIDALWTLMTTDRYTANGPEAIVIADQASAYNYTPAAGRNTAGAPATVSRKGTGRYLVRVPGHTVSNSTAVMLSGASAGTVSSGVGAGGCAIASIRQIGTDAGIDVECSDGPGTPTDSTFWLSVRS